MPPPRFMTSSPKILAVMTAIRMIWWSKLMTLGVACEIFALIGVTWNWVDSYPWLPNVALTLATVGAVVVACRVAWDYHGRGLNAKQTQEVNDILTSVGLNETQSEAMAETIKSSGLTQQQKSDLITELPGIDLVSTVVAQKAVFSAMHQLGIAVHGYVAIIRLTGFFQMDVQCVAPPPARGECQRQHELEPAADFDHLEIAESIYQPYHNPAFLWKNATSTHWCHTNRSDPGTHARELVFSLEDCVPKWRVPAGGDYVLTHDATGRSTWAQKPYEQP